MSLENLCTRNALLNLGTTAVICAVSSRLAPHSQTALLSQAATSITIALAKSLFTQKNNVSDEIYSLSSLVWIAGVGALCGLSWKVNATVSVLFTFGSYYYGLSFKPATKQVTQRERDKQARNEAILAKNKASLASLNRLTQDLANEDFFNIGVTGALAKWAFGDGSEKDVLEFLDAVITHFKSSPRGLKNVLCSSRKASDQRPDYARIPRRASDQASIGDSYDDTPLMLLVKMGGEKAPEAVRKILSYYEEELFSRTPNGNTPLHIAVVTGQFEVAMALMERARELNALDDFLACQNKAGNTADGIMGTMCGDELNRDSLDFCGQVLGGEEVSTARAMHKKHELSQILTLFLKAAGQQLGVDEVTVENVKNSYTLSHFLECSKPSEEVGPKEKEREGGERERGEPSTRSASTPTSFLSFHRDSHLDNDEGGGFDSEGNDDSLLASLRERENSGPPRFKEKEEDPFGIERYGLDIEREGGEREKSSARSTLGSFSLSTSGDSMEDIDIRGDAALERLSKRHEKVSRDLQEAREGLQEVGIQVQRWIEENSLSSSAPISFPSVSRDDSQDQLTSFVREGMTVDPQIANLFYPGCQPNSFGDGNLYPSHARHSSANLTRMINLGSPQSPTFYPASQTQVGESRVVVAEAPTTDQGREAYYKMVVQTGSRVLASATTGYRVRGSEVTPDGNVKFLGVNEEIHFGHGGKEVQVKCTSELMISLEEEVAARAMLTREAPLHYHVKTLEIHVAGQDPYTVVQVVPDFVAVSAPLELAIHYVELLKMLAVKYKLPLDNPIINCNTGKDRSIQLTLVLGLLNDLKAYAQGKELQEVNTMIDEKD